MWIIITQIDIISQFDITHRYSCKCIRIQEYVVVGHIYDHIAIGMVAFFLANAIDSANQITSMDFVGGRLSHVDANLYAWSQLDDIRFDRNPLHCDSQLYWMSIEYRKLHHIRPTNPIPKYVFNVYNN